MGYRTAVVFSLVLMITVVGSASLVSDGTGPIGTADAHHDPPSWSNATFLPVDPEDRRPGATEVTYNIYGGQGIDYIADFLKVESPGPDWSECSTGDLNAEGIRWEGQRKHDRPPSGDDTSTRSDESIVQYSKSPQYRDDGIWVEWYADEDIGGDAPRFNATDEIVVQYSDCFINPDEVGWYQMYIFVNGTDKETGEYVENEYNSHYFAICENCSNRAEAEEELGPPPGQGTDDDTEATPTPTPEGPTATPTPTPVEDTATATATAADTATPVDAEADTATPTDEDDGGMGPTPGDGPGFGSVVAVTALLGAALLARRVGR